MHTVFWASPGALYKSVINNEAANDNSICILRTREGEWPGIRNSNGLETDGQFCIRPESVLTTQRNIFLQTSELADK